MNSRNKATSISLPTEDISTKNSFDDITDMSIWQDKKYIYFEVTFKR